MKLAHIALWTSDLERLTTFWTDHFGAIASGRYHSVRRPGFVSRFLKLADGAAIEIMQGPWIAPAVAQERAGYAHVAISLGSREAVDRMAAKSDRLGILQSGPRMTGDGFYEAVITDPDGNPVEITE